MALWMYECPLNGTSGTGLAANWLKIARLLHIVSVIIVLHFCHLKHKKASGTSHLLIKLMRFVLLVMKGG